jgi:trans-L-3-hydroxyproline dehydratase
MDVKIIEITTFGRHDAVIPEVSGTAHITGQHSFCFDPADPLKRGFIFR